VRRCSVCNEEKPAREFPPRYARCHQCHSKAQMERYHRDPEKYRGRVRAARRARFEKNRSYFLRQVGGGCEACGFNSRPDILQFDHKVPLNDTRARRFSDKLSRMAITNPRLWDEFYDVQVLCPNCHVAKTHDEGSYAHGRREATA